MSLDGFDEWRSTVKVHYLCCGREVPSDVAPEHNIALCSFCYAANEWRAEREEAEITARKRRQMEWGVFFVQITAGLGILGIMVALSRLLVP